MLRCPCGLPCPPQRPAVGAPSRGMRGPAYGCKGRLMWGTSAPPTSRPDAIACLTLPARGLDVSLLDASCHAVWRSWGPGDICPAALAAFAPAPAAHPSCLSLGPALCPMLVCALAALWLHAAAAARPGSLLSCWAALGVLLLSRSLSPLSSPPFCPTSLPPLASPPHAL